MRTRYSHPVTVGYAIFMDDAALEGLSFAPLDEEEGAGWARYFSPEMRADGLIVLVRIGFPRDRERWGDRTLPLVIREAQLASGDSLTAALVRKLPIERIRAAVNHPFHYPNLARYVSQRAFVSVPPGGLWRDSLPDVPRPENPALVIKVPEGGGRRPDEFYGQVADAFAWLSGRTQSPAKDLAEANGVPVSTVHRWVKEARARGLLPPAIGRGSSNRDSSPDPTPGVDGRLPYVLGHRPEDGP